MGRCVFVLSGLLIGNKVHLLLLFVFVLIKKDYSACFYPLFMARAKRDEAMLTSFFLEIRDLFFQCLMVF